MSEDKLRCWVKGIEFGEELEGLDDLLSKLRTPKERRVGLFTTDEQIQDAITRSVDGIGSKIRLSECVPDKLRDELFTKFKNLYDSAKQGDFTGFEERLYDIRDQIGFLGLKRIRVL